MIEFLKKLFGVKPKRKEKRSANDLMKEKVENLKRKEK